MTCPFSHQDGAYLLGGLTPPERRGYEEHLAGCQICAAALSEVAGLPGLLSRLSAEVVEEADPPPAELLPALLRAVASERGRSRRRLWTTAALAVAAVALIAAAIAVPKVLINHDSQATAPVAMTSVSGAPVEATAALTDKSWGTEVDLRCTYSGAAGEHRAYALVAVDRGGNTEQIAVWAVLPYKGVKVIGSSSIHRADLAALEVRDSDGKTLLRLRR